MSSTNLKLEACCDQQWAFVQDPTMYLLASAGYGAGKTYAGALKSFIKVCDNPGIRICVTAPTYKTIGDATFPKYVEVFSLIPDFAEFLHGDNPMARIANGAEIIFRSTDKPDSLRGMEVGSIHMDEPRDSPYYAFQILQARLRQRTKAGTFYPLQCYLTTTPKGLNWIYSEFFLEKRPDHKIYTWSTRDNKFMPKDYYNRLKDQYRNQDTLMKQDLEGEFLNIQGDCVFGRNNLLVKLQTEVLEPKFIEDGYVSIWKSPVIGGRYVAGIDCADTGGNGVNCMVVLDWRSGEEVCEIWGDIPADDFAKLVNKWGRHYNDALLGVERNGVGNSVVTWLKAMHYPHLYTDASGKVGVFTNDSNRTELIEMYRASVDANEAVIRSAKAIEEMLTFVRGAERYDHLEGSKDDRVFARAIAWKMKHSGQGGQDKLWSVKRLATTYA